MTDTAKDITADDIIELLEVEMAVSEQQRFYHLKSIRDFIQSSKAENQRLRGWLDYINGNFGDAMECAHEALRGDKCPNGFGGENEHGHSDCLNRLSPRFQTYAHQTCTHWWSENLD